MYTMQRCSAGAPAEQGGGDGSVRADVGRDVVRPFGVAAGEDRGPSVQLHHKSSLCH